MSRFSNAGELPAEDSCERSLIECVFENNPLLLLVGVSLEPPPPMGTFSLFQSPSIREEAGVSCIFGVSGSSSESAHLPICFNSLDGVANTNPGLLSADASRSCRENAAAAAAGEEDADDDGIGSRDGEDGVAVAEAEPWRSGAAASADDGNGRSAGDSDSGESVAGDSIARQLRLRGRGDGAERPREGERVPGTTGGAAERSAGTVVGLNE